MTSLRVRSKVWLEINGKPLLGGGRERLLNAVERAGSINAAADELGLTYRHAWAQLKEMEKIAPFPLLKRTKGGAGGGGTHLTEDARELLERFARFKCGLRDEIDRRFFIQFPPPAEGDIV